MNARAFVIVAGCALALASCAPKQAEWAPAGDNIMTRWAAEVSPASVHQEYPRPQMVRDGWKSLNGLWSYAITDSTITEMPEAQGDILVPFAIESALSGVGRTVGADSTLWYRRVIEVPREWEGKRIKLNFEAVDWQSEVIVNGMRLGSHTGGYTSFSYDITPFMMKNGRQTIVVKVKDATEKGNLQPRGKQTTNPHGIWYTTVTGIWQSVWLEAVPETSVESYYAIAQTADSTLTVYTQIAGYMDADTVRVDLIDAARGYSAETPGTDVLSSIETRPGKPVQFKVSDVKAWTPDEPYLYGLAISVIRDGQTIDKVQGYAAMRDIRVKADAEGHKRMALNGKPLFHFGPLDQGWWPDGLYTAPTDEALAYDVKMTKEYGYNMIRKHIKVEPARWYTWCDRLGVMVWQDMPSNSGFDNEWGQGGYDEGTDAALSEMAKANYYKEWSEIIEQRKVFPCIVMWVPFNEAWGQFDTRRAVAFTHHQDSTRLVNMSSGGNWVSGGVGDVLDLHHYPEPKMAFWDAEMVNVLGEYGGLGLPVEGHLWQKDKNWGYKEFGTSEEVTDTYVSYANMLEDLAVQGCSAAVYTQTTDVEGEVNGLMTYDREVTKLDVAKVKAANKAVIEKIR